MSLNLEADQGRAGRWRWRFHDMITGKTRLQAPVSTAFRDESDALRDGVDAARAATKWLAAERPEEAAQLVPQREVETTTMPTWWLIVVGVVSAALGYGLCALLRGQL